MKWLRLSILLAILVVVSVFVVWRIGFHVPEPAVKKGPEEKKVAEPNEPADTDEPEDEKPPDEPEAKEPEEPNGPNKPPEPNDPMESINLKDAEMKDILDRIIKWTGAKALIPVDDALKKKITIYAPEKVPRSQALSYIYRALREQGIVAEVDGDKILLRPLKDAKWRAVPTVPDDYELAKLKNRDEIVEKFFKLRHLSPTQLQQVVKPFVPEEHGYVYAIETTNHLVCIDTVTNLLRIQRIIGLLDKPETAETVTETFEIAEGDPVEIVNLLNILVGGGQVGNPSSRSRSRNRDRDRRRDRDGDNNDGESAATVVIGTGDAPITLIPWPQRKWIIAKASPGDMNDIEYWVDKLDQKKPEEREHTMVDVNYADVREVADAVNSMIERMPLRANVTVQPLTRAKQIMIIGSTENRIMVEKLVQEIDIPSEKFLTEHIRLEHADPETVKENIEEMFTEGSSYSRRSSYYSYSYTYTRRRGIDDPDFVRVIAYPTLKQVTVIASADNMEKIKEEIKGWDKAINVDDVIPCVIDLNNTDPVKMAELLTDLFTETRRERSWLDIYMGRGGVTRTIVGPLYGKMAFQAVEDTRKIIVVSQIPEGYEVIKKLVAKLDKEEVAEIPLVKILKYADPEDLAERLNAIFNLTGTRAPIRRSARGISTSTTEDTTEGETGPRDPGNDTSTDGGQYLPPWSTGRGLLGEMPISRIIGRIRFIPDPRSKSILVLTPREYVEEIDKTIDGLDQPGMQVRIKAIVVEVDHRELTSLGVQAATDPAAFGTLDENAITALGALTHMAKHGSITPGTVFTADNSGTRLGISGDITILIDFLVKKIDAKILNEQTLWTKDNEQANFFKGQQVAFIGSDTRSAEGQSTTTTFEYPKIGMELTVRPKITPTKDVDMTIELDISQRTTELVQGQPVRTNTRTGTTLIVQDGETIMLGGMIFQEDSRIERKVPLLGDLPLLGGLFRHNEIVKANVETLVFVTPYVIDEEPANMLAETIDDMEAERDKLKEILTELRTTVENEG
ncbi:MAG: secretin N-terminal domain-containing protein [Planctomycetota bacterium]